MQAGRPPKTYNRAFPSKNGRFMANRLSTIATRTGDDGTTGLGDNSRTRKDALRVQAMGDVDELNSLIGLLLTEPMPEKVRAMLTDVQHDLFDLGGELCIPGFVMVTDAHVARLDEALAQFNADLPRLAEFILPGGTRSAAIAHVCRTVARRAERTVVALGVQEAVNDNPRRYLNRLSDLLFVLARVLNRADGGSDVLWQQRKNG
jgi:cob(I)alamin adenosyltransferase